MSEENKKRRWQSGSAVNGLAEAVIEGDSLEERFEFLYDNGYFKEGDLFHVYRKRLNDFHAHLCGKQSGKTHKFASWKTIAALVDVDYRSVKAFATQRTLVPHKATWKKLKPLLDLLEKKEND